MLSLNISSRYIITTVIIVLVLAATWDPNSNSGGVPQLKGARSFSFEELKKCTNNFAESNCIGIGGYGKVTFSLFFVS